VASEWRARRLIIHVDVVRLGAESFREARATVLRNSHNSGGLDKALADFRSSVVSTAKTGKAEAMLVRLRGSPDDSAVEAALQAHAEHPDARVQGNEAPCPPFTSHGDSIAPTACPRVVACVVSACWLCCAQQRID
jgi:hypothetical protein